MTILMLMWMKMNIMLTWITMTEIVMVNDDNYDADVDDYRCGWQGGIIMKDEVTGWSCSGRRQSRCPQVMCIHDQRSTQHFYSTMINVLHYTYLNPRTTLYKTLFYNHDQRFTLHFSQTMINPTLTLHIYDPSIPSTEVYVLWKVWAQSKSSPYTTSHWKCHPNNITI